MAKRKVFAVIGIGEFGRSACIELVQLGAEVIAVDCNEDAIESIQNIVNNSYIFDSTKESNLTKIGIKDVDHVIIGIGKNVQNSIMTTLILKDLNVKNIHVKVNSEYHAKIVERLGATEFIRAEEIIGKKLARKLIFSSIADYVDLNNKFEIFEVEASLKMQNKTLEELEIRKKFSINICAIRRDKEIIIPTGAEKLEENDILILIGENKKINHFIDVFQK